MKKLLFVLLLCFIATFAFSMDNSYLAIKAGYGQETSGIGAALDVRLNYFGFVVGAGYFPAYGGAFGGELGAKFHLPLADTKSSLWLGAGYGLLGIEYTYSYSTESGSSSSTSTIWGPWALFGGTFVSKGGLLLDGSVGVGYNSSYGALFALQASIGYAFDL